MQFSDGIVAAIGNTPLIRLGRASAETGCLILGKAEFMNPGQSVKDRAALFIIEDAVRRGTLRPGGIIVEGTAGNTGIGLALVGNAMGFRSVIVIPDTQSQEKKDMLRLCGAELVEVPAVPYSNSDNYVKISGRLAARLAESEPNGAVWANQFDNVANREGHVRTTGPEIWQQTDGKVGGFICAVGTGGTLAGVAIALKERNSAIKIGLADPKGAALYSYYTSGVLKSEGSSITEGIGQGRITKPRRCANRPCLSDPRRGSGADHIRPARARRPLPRGLIRHQCRGCDQAGARTRPRQHHRDGARRLRNALPVEIVQSGIPALEGAAGSAMARTPPGHRRCVGTSLTIHQPPCRSGRQTRGCDRNGPFIADDRPDHRELFPSGRVG
jgi:cysteine synthase